MVVPPLIKLQKSLSTRQILFQVNKSKNCPNKKKTIRRKTKQNIKILRIIKDIFHLNFSFETKFLT